MALVYKNAATLKAERERPKIFIHDEINAELRRMGHKRIHFGKCSRAVTVGFHQFLERGQKFYRAGDLHFLVPLVIGAEMEDTVELLKAANKEADESKHILEDIKNKTDRLSELLHPSLLELVKKVRDTRMAVMSEMTQSLRMLEDVRKFFLESDYEKEMQRMERFVSICKEIQKLKAEGVFDAVCDSAIRLAIKETKE